MLLEYAESAFGFKFCGVPSEKLGELPLIVHQVLEKLASEQEEVDMQRMTTIIRNDIQQLLSDVCACVLMSVCVCARACV